MEFPISHGMVVHDILAALGRNFNLICIKITVRRSAVLLSCHPYFHYVFPIFHDACIEKQRIRIPGRRIAVNLRLRPAINGKRSNPMVIRLSPIIFEVRAHKADFHGVARLLRVMIIPLVRGLFPGIYPAAPLIIELIKPISPPVVIDGKGIGEFR